MSKKWKQLIAPTGQMESTVFNTGYDSKYIIIDSVADYKANGGTVKIEFSTSSDQIDWSNWRSLPETDEFMYENTSEKNMYFKVRVVLDISATGVSPKFNSLQSIFKSTHKVANVGDIVCKPKLWITKKNGDGDISLHNLENNQTLSFDNLKSEEQVFVDCENEIIATDIPLIYRYDDHNDVFMEFLEGNNYLLGTGDFKLDLEYQMRLL